MPAKAKSKKLLSKLVSAMVFLRAASQLANTTNTHTTINSAANRLYINLPPEPGNG